MISYDQWKMLNEAFMLSMPLGVSQRQAIGIQSNIPGIGEAAPEVDEAGAGFGMGGMGNMGDMPLELPKKKKAPLGDDLGDEEEDLDDIEHDEEDLDHDEEDLDHDEEDLDHDEEDLDHDELGDEELGDDELGDNDELGMGMMPKKKQLPDKLHNNTPFMSYMKKKMKKEDCGEDHEEGDGELMSKKGEDKPAFLMKKSKKGMKKKMKKESVNEAKKHPEGCKCKMCSAMKKEDTLGAYARPKNYNPKETNEEWLRNVTDMCSVKEIHRKFDSGFQAKEDILLPPPEAEVQAQEPSPGPGEVGWAPQGRIGAPLGGSVAESTEEIANMLRKMGDLEKKFRKSK